ncbi:oxidoreductase (plasmid) [Paracoccus versutus]|jgi:acrylyl-CoA reductase (NADPH)|uniref:Acrylyl-CoA reductase (NADPH) n=1 Tax=Paracoccus versutus TaxID=34007 RepID=A0AAQ0KMQ3_PARVE|nr:MDR family oxidoreductase [Paracoccus versutus]KGJ12672.1 NADPH:quinone dehydrogenase [Paracoccus versutus]REG53322.1 acrylyl-CoA reductase (NADPH) [Paracoccus versutus]WEJ81258.1 oxidoreductase [Paracoccus versutus]
MSSFKALVIEKTDDGQTVALKDFKVADLMDGDVAIRVTHSTLNYKDGLALTGKSPVVRRFPMIPGVDCAGIVEASDNPDFQAGDRVILNGWGTGETHLGSYAEKARVRGDWLIPLPKGLTPSQAMAVGTAGFTAMLSVLALERHGCSPGDGPAIVTGAAGGVGSMAIAFLAKAGWRVVASTGRVSETDYLSELGATEIIERSELSGPGRPLAKERWAVGVDSVGSSTLANLLSSIQYGGAVAACGLAGGMDLPTSVAPFILRSVALLGIDSVRARKSLRLEAWDRIARDLDRDKLAAMTSSIPLADVQSAATDILEGKIRGRVVVDIG